MKHILVPTNFLDYAENAAEYAVHFAAAYGAQITLFHTYHIPVTDPLVPSEYLVELAANAEKGSREKLDALKQKLQALEPNVPLKIDYETTMGFATDEILTAAERHEADMILMGSRHTERVLSILVGSVLGNVLENAKVPVVIVPANVTSYFQVKNIAFASEYNDADDIKFINKALGFATQLKAKLSCVHIELQDDNENEAAKLQAMQDEFVLQVQGGLMAFENIEAHDIVDGLDKYVQYHNVDMTVMVTHKRSFFRKLYDRSLTKKMAFRTNTPLVVFHD